MFDPVTVGAILEHAATAYGERVGVIDEPDQPAEPLGELTYARMAELARAEAAGLDALAVAPGERVVIVSHNSARLLASIFAVPGSGRVLVPVSVGLAPQQVDYVVDDSGSSVLLLDPELEEQLAGVACKHKIVLGSAAEEELFQFGVEPCAWPADESATATINYPSNATARAKGVPLSHRSLWLNALLSSAEVGVNDRDVYLHTLPMFDADGWGLPYAVSGFGGQHIVLRQVDGTEILRRVERHGVTLMCAARAVVAMVLAAASGWEGPIPGRGRVRIVVTGAPPTRMVARLEAELGWEVISGRGWQR